LISNIPSINTEYSYPSADNVQTHHFYYLENISYILYIRQGTYKIQCTHLTYWLFIACNPSPLSARHHTRNMRL